jgi:hypothetical protein
MKLSRIELEGALEDSAVVESGHTDDPISFDAL